MKDKLIGNHDIWLCHNCGDCSTLCPRGAKPGDVMAALRNRAVYEYAQPKVLADAVGDPKKLPILIGVIAVAFILVGLITGLLDFTPEGDEIVHAHFFSTWLVDLFMVPAAMFTVVVFALGLKRFMADMHESALAEGKTDKPAIEPVGFLKSLGAVIPGILKHKKFGECAENSDRSTPHMMVLLSFIGLFIVTSIFFVAIYVFQNHGPYSQLNPVKWLANISGVALLVGSALLIKNRMADTESVSVYSDWLLLGLVFSLAVTGLLTEMTRLAGTGGLSYFIYFVHLVNVFLLFVTLPFTKLAHLVYRTVSMAYDHYIGRSS